MTGPSQVLTQALGYGTLKGISRCLPHSFVPSWFCRLVLVSSIYYLLILCNVSGPSIICPLLNICSDPGSLEELPPPPNHTAPGSPKSPSFGCNSSPQHLSHLLWTLRGVTSHRYKPESCSWPTEWRVSTQLSSLCPAALASRWS